MNNTPKLINEPDDLVEGFHRLDNKILEAQAPRLTFLPGWEDREDDKKIAYLVKLASTMNYAAKLIQDERDQLIDLMEKKEQQLEKMAEAMRQNNLMLQSEVTKMNSQRQEFLQQMAEKNALIRKLRRSIEDGNLQELEH